MSEFAYQETNKQKQGFRHKAQTPDIYGAPGGIRTPDTRIRSPVLYPAELRARRGACGEEVGILPGKAGKRQPCERVGRKIAQASSSGAGAVGLRIAAYNRSGSI